MQLQILWSRQPLLLYLADAGARRSNSGEFSAEQTGSQAPKWQHNIRLLFKLKRSVLTPAHKSQKKGTNTSSSAKPSVGNTSCCCFYNITYNCGREWLCDYRGNSSALQRQLSTVTSLRRERLKMQLVADGGAKPDRSRNAADSIQWNLGVSDITRPYERA